MIIFMERELRRREIFLRRFDQTARVVFTGQSKKKWDPRAQKLLIDLARSALNYSPETPWFTVRKDLARVWRCMTLRKIKKDPEII